MPQQAFHFIVQRDHAKKLFAAAKGPAALAEFLGHLATADDLTDKRLLTGDNWQELHDLLNDAAPDSPLGQAILGGRPLSQDADQPVMLVRPDIVPAVAEAISNLELDSNAPQEQVRAIGKLFGEAAQLQAAVVFAVVRQK